MPSFSDSIFIFILALMLFGPKKLPQLARQLGKLMAEFRRASNEFRMQMDDELRIEEQKEHQQKVAALAGPPSDDIPTEDPAHPHMPAPASAEAFGIGAGTQEVAAEASNISAESSDSTAGPEPPQRKTVIAESGELKMMPPSTGLPLSHRSGNGYIAADSGTSALPEHSILPPSDGAHAGMSSEDPAAEHSASLESAGEAVHHA